MRLSIYILRVIIHFSPCMRIITLTASSSKKTSLNFSRFEACDDNSISLTNEGYKGLFLKSIWKIRNIDYGIF